MIKIDIPGRGMLTIEQAVFDFNGTLATDGKLNAGVRERLEKLAKELKIFILTADTVGTAGSELAGINVEVVRTRPGGEDVQKRDFIRRLGSAGTVAFGNGANDVLMLEEAGLSVTVVGAEGACAEALSKADIVVRNSREALDLMLNPKRVVATLRR